MLTERADPLVGGMLGQDYRVIEPIGFGGMAVVYLVEHQTLMKQFAAKVLSVELARNFEARARFTQEAHSASQLDHENIVNISDFGVTPDQRPFFVMELLRGQTLDKRIAAGAMSLEEIVAVSVPVGKALAFAHAEGIVHRDIKPENIFLVQRSRGRWAVKVVDFGIAKTPHSDHLTKVGQALGSPHFMSPEACRGDEVDHRADIYSFGVLLYLMACGRLPFDDANLLKVLQLHVLQALTPPCEVNPALPAAIGAVIERAMAKQPDARFASMDELLLELQAAIPAGADRLLIEQQSGGASAFRATPFPNQSQPMAAVSPAGLTPQSAVMAGVVAMTPATPMIATGSAPIVVPAGPKQRNRVVIGVAAAATLVVGAIVIWLATRGGGGGGGGESTATATRASHGAPAASAPGIAVPPELDARGAKPAAAVTRHVQIATEPAGAAVTLDGQSLGETPVDVELEIEGSGAVSLVVTKPGYVVIEQRVTLDRDVSLQLPLVHVKPVAAPAVKKPVVRNDGKRPAGAKTPNKGSPDLDIRLSR